MKLAGRVVVSLDNGNASPEVSLLWKASGYSYLLTNPVSSVHYLYLTEKKTLSQKKVKKNSWNGPIKGENWSKGAGGHKIWSGEGVWGGDAKN